MHTKLLLGLVRGAAILAITACAARATQPEPAEREPASKEAARSAVQTAMAAKALSKAAAATVKIDSGVYTLESAKTFSKIFAISDIHGRAGKLRKLLRAAKLTDDDGKWRGGRALLIIVGDSIDKGHRSIDVLNTFIELAPQAKKAGGAIVHLLGNHETEFLDDPDEAKNDKKAKEFIDEIHENGEKVRDYFDLANPRARFLRTQPVAAKIGKWLFLHTGYFPAITWEKFAAKATTILKAGDYQNKWLDDDHDGIMEQYDWWRDKKDRRDIEKNIKAAGFVGAVFGHQDGAFNCHHEICLHIDEPAMLIKLDTGMGEDHDGHVLEFPKPAQLFSDKVPTAYSIDEDGERVGIKILDHTN